MRRRGRWFLLGAIGVVACLVVAHNILDSITERRRDESVARLQEKLAALIPELQPGGDENHPLGMRAQAEQAASTSGDRAAYPRGVAVSWEHLFSLLDERLCLKPNQGIDEVFLMANQDLIHEIWELAELGVPPVAGEALEDPVEEMCSFPDEQDLKYCMRLLREDAFMKAAQQDYPDTVRDIIAWMKLGDTLDYPLTYSLQLQVIMEEVLPDAFEDGNTPPDITHALLTQLAASRNREMFKKVFVTQTMDIGEEMSSIFHPPLESDPGNWVLAALFRPWCNMNEQTYAEKADQLADLVDLPYYQAEPKLTEIRADLDSVPRSRFVSAAFLSYVCNLFESEADHEARLDLARMAVVLEQHRARHGQYPDALDAVAPDLGGALPVDPFTGEPYHYEPSGDSFQLYSVGSNRVDDGGRQATRDGDIAWRGRDEE